jgi:hypothetical protein
MNYECIHATSALPCMVQSLFVAHACTCARARAVCVEHTCTQGESALDVRFLAAHSITDVSITSQCSHRRANTCHVLHRVRGITTPMFVWTNVGPLGACPRDGGGRWRGTPCLYTGRSSASASMRLLLNVNGCLTVLFALPPKALWGL